MDKKLIETFKNISTELYIEPNYFGYICEANGIINVEKTCRNFSRKIKKLFPIGGSGRLKVMVRSKNEKLRNKTIKYCDMKFLPKEFNAKNDYDNIGILSLDCNECNGNFNTKIQIKTKDITKDESLQTYNIDVSVSFKTEKITKTTGTYFKFKNFKICAIVI